MKKLLFIFLIIFSSQSFANVAGKSLWCNYEEHHIGVSFLDENKVEVFYIKGKDVLKTDTTYLEKGLNTIEIKRIDDGPYGKINRKELSMFVYFFDYHNTGNLYKCVLKNSNEKFLTRKDVVNQLYFVIKNSGNQF